jgi:hypothetical protein
VHLDSNANTVLSLSTAAMTSFLIIGPRPGPGMAAV